jgi:hypothetical protein
MPFTRFAAVAALIVAFGFLGFRILDLEQRVAQLSEQLGLAKEPEAGSATTSSTSALPKNYEQRISQLEQQLASITAAISGPRRAPETVRGPANIDKEQDILSVIERENNRVRDVQLEWHRARWLETRERQLVQFAMQTELEPQQTSKLRDAIEHELDTMVDIMKRPNFADDPDQVAADWAVMLEATDKSAAEILTPEQLRLWGQGRLFERSVLWPWLPPQHATAKN